MENTENVVPETIMNPTNQPVSFYGDNSRNTDGALLAALVSKDPYAPALDSVSADGICSLRHEVGEVKAVVKDAEADIRREIAKSEADIRADIHSAECATIKAIGDSQCAITKEVMETKFAVTKEVLETKHSLAKDILKSEYENKLALQTALKEINLQAQHNAERSQDKTAHYFEELNEELVGFRKDQAVCCCEVESALSLLTGGVLPAKK